MVSDFKSVKLLMNTSSLAQERKLMLGPKEVGGMTGEFFSASNSHGCFLNLSCYKTFCFVSKIVHNRSIIVRYGEDFEISRPDLFLKLLIVIIHSKSCNKRACCLGTVLYWMTIFVQLSMGFPQHDIVFGQPWDAQTSPCHHFGCRCPGAK